MSTDVSVMFIRLFLDDNGFIENSNRLNCHSVTELEGKACFQVILQCSVMTLTHSNRTRRIKKSAQCLEAEHFDISEKTQKG